MKRTPASSAAMEDPTSPPLRKQVLALGPVALWICWAVWGAITHQGLTGWIEDLSIRAFHGSSTKVALLLAILAGTPLFVPGASAGAGGAGPEDTPPGCGNAAGSPGRAGQEPRPGRSIGRHRLASPRWASCRGGRRPSQFPNPTTYPGCPLVDLDASSEASRGAGRVS